MGRQRGKKDEGGSASKNQPVISRFFAPKPAEQSGKESTADPGSPSPGTVVWPSAGRLSSLNRTTQNVVLGRKRSSEDHEEAGTSSSKKLRLFAKDSPKEHEPEHSFTSSRGLDVAHDPNRHKQFLETLLQQADATSSAGGSGVVFYGKPPSGNEKLTPLEQQVVELKAKYPDVLLMIEVGYKFRFFGDDAEEAAKVLGIVAYYSHSFLTASVPTFRLHVHVRRLVEAGYKVGVVKQTETAAIKAQGSNKSAPFARDLSALYTKATLEAGEFLGGDECGEQDGATRLSSYIMCVVEEPTSVSRTNVSSSKQEDKRNFDSRFGVVAVETSTGDVMYGDFLDNVTRTELEARLLACAPAELLLSASLTASTKKLLLDYAGSQSEVRVENVSEDTYKGGGAAAALADFFGTRKSQSVEGKVDGGLEALMSMPDLVVAAFGHILCYLRQFGLENILRLGGTFRPFVGQQEMMLSSNTLRQLEILCNQSDGGEKGSLFWLINHTKTSFGARLLRYWITHPLKDQLLISSRLDAVSEIAESIESQRGGHLAPVLLSLEKLTDVERGLTRIFHRTATTAEFISVIRSLLATAVQFQQVEKSCRSGLLSRLVSAVASSSVLEHADRLLTSLNPDAAAAGDKLNLFVPGRYPEVDGCKEAIKSIEKELESFLPGYQKLVKVSNLQYCTVAGTSFLIEVPCAQRVPADWLKVTSTKKVHRYHPPEVLQASERLAVAKEQLGIACCKAWDMFLTDFASHYVDFRASGQALAALDCLYSLAVVSRNKGYVRPTFVSDSEECVLSIEAGRHPVLDSILQDAFVPNDTFLSGGGELSQIITGPNMGGKSCYIRQVALIVVMAQIGSYIPAASAKLHVFDAVFTRMGIQDRLGKGTSTFYEELSEASVILQKATARSLVVMDELGRGTSTHDGVAIAYSTIYHLLQQIKCFTLFVTHYLKIAEIVKEFPGNVRPFHMSYLAESSGDDGGQQASEVAQKITFLYKLRPGAASRSFGINVARMAKIPESCVARAAEKAATFEEKMSRRHDVVRLVDQVICEKDVCALWRAQEETIALVSGSVSN